MVQYLDDILFLGRDKQEVARVTGRVASQLVQEGYLISPKSWTEPVEDVTWMAKHMSAAVGRSAPQPTAIADCVARWVGLVTHPCTRNAVRRILGRLVWLGRPRNTASPFWAGTQAWVHQGPRWVPRTPPAMVVGLLEGLAAAQRRWEPSCSTDTLPKAPQLHVDAAETPWGLYMVGLWGPKGACI